MSSLCRWEHWGLEGLSNLLKVIWLIANFRVERDLLALKSMFFNFICHSGLPWYSLSGVFWWTQIVKYVFWFFFNWRIIALWCCVCFYHTLMWINHDYTLVPSLLNLLPAACPQPPLRVVTEHWLSLLCYIATSHYIPLLRMVMYIFHCYSQFDVVKFISCCLDILF